MATITELKSRREALAASRSSGVARVSYDGKTVDYRSLAEIDRAIEVLDREIATADGRKIIRQVAVSALRGEVLPERVPPAGLLILRDGEPGEPEVTLSPLRYHYQHRAEIEAVVQGAARDAAFDTLCASIGAAIAADRTLGGLCDWIEAEAPRPVDLAVEGAASLKAAVIPVILHYSTADPLG